MYHNAAVVEITVNRGRSRDDSAGMKMAFVIALAVLLAAPARGAWPDLKRGMDQATVIRCIGAPMMQNRGRGGAETWTYDNSGYVSFERGRVSCWQAPKPARRTGMASAHGTAAPVIAAALPRS